MTHKYRVFLLLLIVGHYMYGRTHYDLPGNIIIPPSKHTIPNLSVSSDVSLSPFLQTVKTLPAPIPAVYFGAIAGQITSQQSLFISELHYTEHNDVFYNHPISIYKIALSTHTAVG